MKSLIVCLLFLFLGAPFAARGETTFCVGRDPTWYPLDLKEKNPNVNAFINALIAEMNKKRGPKINLVDIAWVVLFNSLEEKKLNAIFSSLTPNLVTVNKYSFSDPILSLGPVLVVPVTSSVTTLKELEGKKVGISPYNNSNLIVQKYPTIAMKHYENMATALFDLSRGQIAAVLMDRIDAESLVSALYPTQLQVIPTPLNELGLRLITLKETHPDLIRFFNSQLKKLKKNNTYSNLLHEFSVN